MMPAKRMVVACMVLLVSVGLATAGTSWETDFEKASATAKASNRYMLLDFSGSDWCGWCIKLDNEVFSKKDFKQYAEENLVCVLLDFPRGKSLKKELKEQNSQLQGKFGVRGFPTVIILSPTGERVANTGYREGGPEKYVEYLKSVIDPHRKQKNIPLPGKGTVATSQFGRSTSVFARPAATRDLPRDESREVRSWTSASGSTVDASLLEESGASVTLKTADGKSVRIAKGNLSQGDREYIESLKADATATE